MDFFKPYKRSETSVETHPIHPHTHYLASVATIYPWLIQVVNIFILLLKRRALKMCVTSLSHLKK